MHKLISYSSAEKYFKKVKSSKRKIILCHGAFDLIHLGHIKHFKAAKKFGDFLVVSITKSSLLKKGLNRPFYNDKQRIEFLSSLDCVDCILLSNTISAEDVLKKVKPNFYCKGSDYKNLRNDVTGKILYEKKLTEKNGGKLVFTDEETFSSSSIINNSNLNNKIIYAIKSIKKNYDFNKILSLFDSFKNKKILLIGDLILDEYIYVSALGKPSKENIIATLYNKKEIYLGGIFSSIGNLSLFNENIDVVTSFNIKDSKLIKKGFPKRIKKKLLFSQSAPTVKKTRFVMDGHAHLKKIFEIYEMDDSTINIKNENIICKYLNDNIKKYDLIVVNDYGHGLITDKIVKNLNKKNNFLAVNAQINAGNFGYNLITKYTNANYYSVDFDEAKKAVGLKYAEPEVLAKKILDQTKGEAIAITLGSKGSFFKKKGGQSYLLPAFSNAIVDTMSAGDAFFGLSLISYYLTKSHILSPFLGNLAATLTVAKKGCVPIEKSKFIDTLHSYFKTK